MGVFHRGCVELSEVHTELQAAVLLLYHDDRGRPVTVGGTDDAAGQHMLKLGISSRRTAGFWQRYGWRSGAPSVSMVC